METEDVQSQLDDRLGNIVPVPVVAMVPLIAQVNCVNTININYYYMKPFVRESELF